MLRSFFLRAVPGNDATEGERLVYQMTRKSRVLRRNEARSTDCIVGRRKMSCRAR